MAYFEDLSPYTYFAGEDGRVNVGWLSNDHAFDRTPFPEAHGLVAKLEILSRKPKNVTRGHHTCDLCSPSKEIRQNEFYLAAWELPRSGNGEIHIDGPSGRYAAPALIWHYISEHQYRPPTEFIEAVNGIWIKDIL